MQKAIDRLEAAVFLGTGTEIVLSDGRKIAVPRWSARKALTLGRKIALAVSGAASAGESSKAAIASELLPLAGEVVCETLGADESFLDSITKEDLAGIALAIIEQEFMSEGFRALSKKAAALLRPPDSEG